MTTAKSRQDETSACLEGGTMGRKSRKQEKGGKVVWTSFSLSCFWNRKLLSVEKDCRLLWIQYLLSHISRFRQLQEAR